MFEYSLTLWISHTKQNIFNMHIPAQMVHNNTQLCPSLTSSLFMFKIPGSYLISIWFNRVLCNFIKILALFNSKIFQQKRHSVEIIYLVKKQSIFSHYAYNKNYFIGWLSILCRVFSSILRSPNHIWKIFYIKSHTPFV